MTSLHDHPVFDMFRRVLGSVSKGTLRSLVCWRAGATSGLLLRDAVGWGVLGRAGAAAGQKARCMHVYGPTGCLHFPNSLSCAVVLGKLAPQLTEAYETFSPGQTHHNLCPLGRRFMTHMPLIRPFMSA